MGHFKFGGRGPDRQWAPGKKVSLVGESVFENACTLQAELQKGTQTTQEKQSFP
jgi:hypothetical protein